MIQQCNLCIHPIYPDKRIVLNPRSLIENCECTCIDKKICHKCFEQIKPSTNSESELNPIYQCPYCRNNITRFIAKFFKDIFYHHPSDTSITLASLMFLEQIPLYRIKNIESKIFASIKGELSVQTMNCMDSFSESECQFLDFYFPLINNFNVIDRKITFGVFIEKYPRLRPLLYQQHRQVYLSNKMSMKLQFYKNAAVETQMVQIRRSNGVQFDSDIEST